MKKFNLLYLKKKKMAVTFNDLENLSDLTVMDYNKKRIHIISNHLFGKLFFNARDINYLDVVSTEKKEAEIYTIIKELLKKYTVAELLKIFETII